MCIYSTCKSSDTVKSVNAAGLVEQMMDSGAGGGDVQVR